MRQTYRIRDWDKNFENNRTRELKRLTFVCVPNKHDGDGYTELLDHPNGAAHLGAWLALVQVASKCDERGTLLRGAQKPHDMSSLARITRIPKEVFVEAMPRLIEIGWIEELRNGDTQEVVSVIDVTEIPQDSAESCDSSNGAIPQDGAEKRLLNGREWKGMEGNGTGGDAASAATPSGPDPEREFVEAWNNSPGVVKSQKGSLTDKRRKQFRARCRDPEWNWREALGKFPLKCFDQPGNWRPDLDWFLKPDSVQKILEGKYDWDPARKPARPDASYNPSASSIRDF